MKNVYTQLQLSKQTLSLQTKTLRAAAAQLSPFILRIKKPPSAKWHAADAPSWFLIFRMQTVRISDGNISTRANNSWCVANAKTEN